MKKNITKIAMLSLVALGLSLSAQAQWTRNAGNGVTFLSNTNDKVGIGTNLPSYSLDIKQDGNCSFRVQSKDNGSSNMILSRSTAGGANCLVNYKTGNTDLWRTGCTGNDDFTINNAGGTSNLYISQATGFVGIGVTNPATRLHVVGTGRFDGNLKVTGNSTFNSSMTVTANITATGSLNSQTLNVAGLSQLGDTISFGSVERFIDGGSSTIATNASFVPEVSNSYNLGTSALRWYQLYTSSNATIGGNLSVSSNATIGGTLGINNLSPVTDIHLVQTGNGGIASTGGMSYQYVAGSTTWKTMHTGAFYSFILDNVREAYIDLNGTYVVTSDARLKKNVQSFSTVLDKVMQLRPASYNYISNDTREKFGFIAQEVEKIFPQVVYTAEDGIMGVGYSEFAPIAIKAIQELNTENIDLKSEVSDLKKQLQDMNECLQTVCNTQTQRSEMDAATTAKSSLEQNQPNPFNQSTVINYQLNKGDQNAQIMVRDLSGNMVKQINLNQTGKGQVTINAHELAQGTYTYTLMVSGQSIDTKLMVVTK